MGPGAPDSIDHLEGIMKRSILGLGLLLVATALCAQKSPWFFDGNEDSLDSRRFTALTPAVNTSSKNLSFLDIECALIPENGAERAVLVAFVSLDQKRPVKTAGAWPTMPARFDSDPVVQLRLATSIRDYIFYDGRKL